MDPLQNPAFVIFAAAISPLLVALVKQQGFSTQVNALIALAVYVVVGIAGTVVSGETLTLENAVALIATTVLVGSAAYNLFWNNLMTGDARRPTPSLDARITSATSFIH